ncbi:hypothetical protein [Neisseria sicca]|nr:hypothetical protein [Neisseria sicca]
MTSNRESARQNGRWNTCADMPNPANPILIFCIAKLLFRRPQIAVYPL